MNEIAKIEITKRELFEAMFEITMKKDGALYELIEHMPVMTLLFPILGGELWEKLQEQARVKLAADAIVKAVTEEDK